MPNDRVPSFLLGSGARLVWRRPLRPLINANYYGFF